MALHLALFGDHVCSKLTVQPLESMNKRELELILLRSALDSGFLDACTENLAETCCIPIYTCAWLFDRPCLKAAPMRDTDGVMALVGSLRDSKLVPCESHFSFRFITRHYESGSIAK